MLKLKDTFIITYNEDTKVVNLAVKDMEEKGYKKLSITPVSRKTEFTSNIWLNIKRLNSNIDICRVFN